MTTTLLSPYKPTRNLPSSALHEALKIAVGFIRQHGAIEDTKLAAMVEAEGFCESYAGMALVRIMDNVQHELWTAELGRLPISILDAQSESGEDSWAYVWNG